MLSGSKGLQPASRAIRLTDGGGFNEMACEIRTEERIKYSCKTEDGLVGG